MKIDFSLAYWTQLFYIVNRDALSVPSFFPNVPIHIEDSLFNQYWEKVKKFTLLDPYRAKKIWDLAMEAKDLEGDFIECGSHQGGLSFLLAFLIRHFKLNKKIFLCDSFQGLPEPDPSLDSIFQKGYLATDLKRCLAFIQSEGLESIAIVKAGWFEETLQNLPQGQKFSLIHIDCDLYKSTQTCFERLYPLTSEKTPIILDDYNIPSPGERKVAKEWLSKTEETLELGAFSQAYFRKGIRYPVMKKTIQDPEGHLISCQELNKNNDYLKFLQEIVSHYEFQTKNMKFLIEALTSGE